VRDWSAKGQSGRGICFHRQIEYALRAIVYLAGRKQACTIHHIAEFTNAPPAYLAKVLQNLSRADLVRSQRVCTAVSFLPKMPAPPHLGRR